MAPSTASPTTPRNPTNLPAAVTSFIGRRQEVADVRRLLGAGRLVTLTGVGGVGKTRLALRVAGDVVASYPDGVWMIELATLRGGDGDGIAHAVADVLGLRAVPGTPLAASLAAHLADRAALLVLDNCEHVVAPTAALVHDLLRRCPALHVLVTSREPLGLDGEHVSQVPVLPFPARNASGGPDALIRYDSVNLFVERAAAGCPGFALTPGNSASVVEICSALDGIPLAIELAAVQVRSLPLDAILARLMARSPSRGRERLRVPSHHSTLRASVEWSHELCTPEERTLWARLAVFSGGFDLDAAHAICWGPDEPVGDVTGSVAALVEKSIVVHEPATGRYRMLEILREFGEERLADNDGDLAAAVVRHRDWFVALAESSAMCWLGPEQPVVLERLQREYGNLRVAFSRSLTDPASAAHALVIASALEHYWLIRGWQSEGRQWLDEALAVTPARTPERARALRVDAYLAALQGDAVVAATMAAESGSIAGELGDRVQMGYASMINGVVRLCTGAVEEARGFLEAALERFRAEGEGLGEAYTLVILVAVAAAAEDTSLAELCHRRCLDLTEPVDEQHLRAFSLWGRGLAALREGDHTTAMDLERESLRLKRNLRDQLGMVLCIEALAWTDVVRGEDERAALMLGGSERLWSPMRMTIGSIFDFGRFRAEYESALAGRLGQRRFEAALKRGGRMSVDDVLRLALGEEQAGPAETSPLTPREQEIAQLVAQGLTNRRIALDLTLSQRTVEGHVERIMTKLGFGSRTQIAAWTAEQRAAGVPVGGGG